MACACKVNKELDYLHKKYGNKIPVSKKTEISFRFKEGMKKFGITLLLIPVIPLMVFYVLYKSFSKNKTISITKTLGILKHG